MEGEYSNKYMCERVKCYLNCCMTENTGTKAPSFTVASKTLRKFWKHIHEQQTLKSGTIVFLQCYILYAVLHRSYMYANICTSIRTSSSGMQQLLPAKFEVEVIIYVIMHIYVFDIKIYFVVPCAWSWAIYPSDEF